MPASSFETSNFRFLVVHGEGLRHLRGAALIWQAAEASDPVFKQPASIQRPIRQADLPVQGWLDAWLDLSAHPEWTGTAANLGLILAGEPGSNLQVVTVALLPDSLGNRFAWLLASWASQAPWSQRSINFYLGEAQNPPFETPSLLQSSNSNVPLALRVPIVLAFLLGGLGTYLSLLWLWRSRLSFDWRLAGALFFIAWLALDAPWQWQLWNQLGDTREAFAGKSGHEKALSAEDGVIYGLIEQIEPLLGEPPARVFIASPQEYLGLRAAYRLYPHNPYWARNRRHELPRAAKLGSGDFILALQSRALGFAADSGQLSWPENQQVAVERLYVNPLGQLYRVR